MIKSLNTTTLLSTKGCWYKGIGNKVGSFLIGDKALEFYCDVNTYDYIQIPYNNILKVLANVSFKKVSRHFEIHTDAGNFMFVSKDSGKILKLLRNKIGNNKILRKKTLIQTIISIFKH